MLRGRIIYVDRRRVWLARGTQLLSSSDGGLSWSEHARVPVGWAGRIVASTRLSRRLVRGGIHHFLPGSSDIAIAGRYVFKRGAEDEPFRPTSRVHGSRPLALATDGQLVCYGEYRPNLERSAVHVWGSRDQGCTWERLWCFEGVRHIHGVYFDPHCRMFWVTTGDDDQECGIWRSADQFRTLEKVTGGAQRVRAVDLCFTEDHVYFGSDTPLERNFIYRIERRSGEIECLQEVGSSVFFGCRVAGHLFFSTVAEPSSVNRTDRAEIWHSLDGKNWQLLRCQTKDRWPMRAFQYGQILFPGGPGDDEHLFFTPLATVGDQCTCVIPLSELDARSHARR